MPILETSFPGGVKVDISYKGHTIRTDQPTSAGGDNAALSPFDLFLSSIVGCMAFYALRFCQERQIPTEGLSLTVEPVKGEDGKRIAALRADLVLPPEFPAKYREAIVRSIDHCSVKQHMVQPPTFDLKVHAAETVSSQ
jgi:putative redox protein